MDFETGSRGRTWRGSRPPSVVTISVDFGRDEPVQSEIGVNADAAFQEGNTDDKIRKNDSYFSFKTIKITKYWTLFLFSLKYVWLCRSALDWVNTAEKKEKHVEAECFFVAALFVLCLISGLHIYCTRVNKFLPRERVSCFSDSCCFYAIWKFARGEKRGSTGGSDNVNDVGRTRRRWNSRTWRSVIRVICDTCDERKCLLNSSSVQPNSIYPQTEAAAAAAQTEALLNLFCWKPGHTAWRLRKEL